ncbi:5-oxoprolinase subunit B family protein [Hoyosella altamirensis]|uniref:KipI family sensor histidine kinase inhibitor n=1 Tax=Hoyosella altamirensis TaxID=616997 RepID=A0A839RKR4_9ACTN|nr:allophanate hydrolase subunit 1 [Hoyosella altamirensis]MBB3037472.1 KipI family sensor histidine kinase inhibitor [Hoyosella altamirensis]
MRILTAGPAAVLAELASLEDVLSTFTCLKDSPPPGSLDVIPAARTVLIRFDTGRTSADAVIAHLRSLPVRNASAEAEGTVITIDVNYNGPDLDDVAEHTGLSTEDVIEAHTGKPWTVAFGGFAPGFAYLVGGDERLHVPRRRDPRKKVEAGSVGLAGEFSGIYPRSSPGGWQLIGTSDATLWDPENDPPALLRPGVRVQFRVAP